MGVGVTGRTVRLPDKPEEQRARLRLLGALGLGERAVIEAPPKGERVHVIAELHPRERDWLAAATRKLGLTRHGAPSRLVRVMLRALMVHRDLLGIDLDLDTAGLSWIDEIDTSPGDRIAAWLDSLPTDTLALILDAVQSAIDRRSE